MLDAFRERKNEVSQALSGLSHVAEVIGAKTLKERVEKDLVRKLEEDRFHLVVVGEFNHGKSSFVNALLGEKALPTGVTPTTAAIHHLKFAEAPSATVVYESGRREDIPYENVRRFAVGGGESAEQIDYLEVGYPAPLLRERILLVDTPGVNDLSLQRSDITYSYIPRADAVLFLLDAGQILKESERVFLEDKLLKASRDKIIFVITKWDILSEAERGEALEYAKVQLAKMVKDPIVFPVSAETHLAGKHDESGMPALLAHLTRFLSEERGRIMLDNALGEGLSLCALLGKGVDARRRAAEMQGDELDRRIKLLEQDLAGQAGTIEERRTKIREEIGGIKAAAQKDLERFVDDTIRQLPSVIENAKQDELKQYLPAFLEDTFRKWAEAETKEVAGKLEDLAERTIAMIRDDAQEANKRVATVLGTDVKRLEVHVDTFQYDAGVAGLLAIGGAALFVNVFVGVLLIAAAPVLAMVFKDKVGAEYKKRALELSPAVVRQAAEKVGPKLDEIIEDFATKLDAWVRGAGEDLHRELLEVLGSARDARDKGQGDVQSALAEVASQQSRLDAETQALEALRASLWAPKEKVRIAEAPAAEITATA
jgi:small GTP-binding protein